MRQKETSAPGREFGWRRLLVSDPDQIPLKFIATQKARMSRLAIILAVVAWYFLKRSVAKKASSAAALSHASNSMTWFASFCETTILSWWQPGSFTAAAPDSCSAAKEIVIRSPRRRVK